MNVESRMTNGDTHLLIATSTPNKLREIGALLAAVPATLHSLAELPPVAEPDETGATFADNARLKAHYYSGHLAHTDLPWAPAALTVAEDSGLVIDALDGEPGVRSARFLRPDATYAERFEEIYRRLSRRPARTPTRRAPPTGAPPRASSAHSPRSAAMTWCSRRPGSSKARSPPNRPARPGSATTPYFCSRRMAARWRRSVTRRSCGWRTAATHSVRWRLGWRERRTENVAVLRSITQSLAADGNESVRVSSGGTVGPGRSYGS